MEVVEPEGTLAGTVVEPEGTLAEVDTVAEGTVVAEATVVVVAMEGSEGRRSKEKIGEMISQYVNISI